MCLPLGVVLSDRVSDYSSHTPDECFPAIWEPKEEQGERENAFKNKVM